MKRILILSLLASIQVFASTYSISIEEARARKIDAIINRENDLYGYARQYILETGDLTPTRNEISVKYDIGYDFWTNYVNEICANDGTYCTDDTSGGIKFINDNVNHIMTFSSVLGSNLSSLVDTEKSRYQLSENKHRLSSLTSDRLGRVIKHDDTLRNTIRLAEKIDLDPNKYRKDTAPADVSKAWYKPNGTDGGYEVFYYNINTSAWESRGVIGAGAYTESDGGVLDFKASDGFDAKTTPGNLGDRAEVVENGVWNKYKHDGTEWLLVSGGGSSSGIDGQIIAEVGDLDYILDRDEDNKYYNAGSGSSFRVTHSLFKGGQTNVDFRRYIKYWVTDTPIEVPNFKNKNIGYYASTRNVYITDDMSKLPSCTDGDVAFIKGNTVWEADTKNTATPQYEAVCLNTMWYESLPSLEKLVDKATLDDKWYIVETAKTFENSKAISTIGYWHSDFTVVNYLGLNTIHVTKGDRSDLPAPSNSNVINLTAIFGDDAAYTTTGINSTYVYNGAYFLQWYYSVTGTAITNSMLDAILVTDNPYTNSNAISVGVALKNSKLITKSGNYWYYGSSLVDKDLTVRSSTTYVQAIAQSYAGYYVLPIATTWGNETFDDKAISSYGSFSTSTLYRDSNNVASTITAKGYNKYCYEQIPLNWRTECNSLTYDTNINKLLRDWKLDGASFASAWLYGYSGCWYEYYPYSSKVASCSSYGTDVWYK